jgi:hypothetical protein
MDSLNLHAVTGVIAIAVMFFHAVWATVALHKNDARAKQMMLETRARANHKPNEIKKSEPAISITFE